jgi:alkaline phosphatase D
LLSCIVEHKVQNVVFLSGDIHCSNVAELSFSGSPSASRLKAFSITSSAFYWPFFFADGEASDYVHDSSDPATPDTFDIDGDISMDYTATSFTQEDNFCRIDINRSAREITVSVFDTEGEAVKENRRKLETTLTLARW